MDSFPRPTLATCGAGWDRTCPCTMGSNILVAAPPSVRARPTRIRPSPVVSSCAGRRIAAIWGRRIRPLRQEGCVARCRRRFRTSPSPRPGSSAGGIAGRGVVAGLPSVSCVHASRLAGGLRASPPEGEVLPSALSSVSPGVCIPPFGIGFRGQGQRTLRR